jgi:hypothetical protein
LDAFAKATSWSNAMMKFYRPYIPLDVRIQVAERQMQERMMVSAMHFMRLKFRRKGEHLDALLRCLSSEKLDLHHRPALVNRDRRKSGSYIPDANDPDYLIYLPTVEHDVETRVRGVGAQRSDLGQRRYNKKVARNRSKDPKRPSRWPKGRKLRSRPINARWRRRKLAR